MKKLKTNSKIYICIKNNRITRFELFAMLKINIFSLYRTVQGTSVIREK